MDLLENDLTVGDRLAIRELTDRYLINMDRYRHDDWYDTVFTEDAWVKFPLGEFVGFAGLAEFHAEGRRRFERTLHVAGGIDIAVEGDTASVRAQLTATHVHRAADPTTYFSLGGYYDADVVRLAEGWRMRRLEFVPVWVGGTAELPEVFRGN
ncbi:nuclear transport factor 2 family protein [Amycolatopsis sp. NPDC059657]|uniref:nuclear transport factor 2 family protein n=1 Tax=Amycolatopsis sp. NPDC059657 TaxID=3346899 RepID=UPI003672D6B1